VFLAFVQHKIEIEGESMKALMMMIAAGALVMAGQANADDAKALAQKSGCLACHSVDNKILGPAYKDVAAKYKGKPEMQAKLEDKVCKGGSGVWGPIPMPANCPNVKKEDIHTIVSWVLSL
jgi:cytochrome c